MTLAVLALMPVPPATAGEGTAPGRAPDSFFGVHYGRVGDGSWPQAPVGAIRLWDTGTTWRDLQPVPGGWAWGTLDAAVANARRHSAAVTLVLGQTPDWASTRPCVGPATLGPGASSPPYPDVWAGYVRTVAERYRGRIAAYEVWNEADLNFWCGSPAQMADLTRLAAREVHAADPAATVVGPSFIVRGGRGWLRGFAAAGGFADVDAVAVHSYPWPEEAPEDAAARLHRERRFLVGLGVNLPLWDTETNMTDREQDQKVQAAELARTYLLRWSAGVRVVHWYAWGSALEWGTHLAAASGSSAPSEAGVAFRTVRRWMRGSMSGCVQRQSGVWRCAFTYGPHRAGVVRWSPDGTVTRRAPAAALWVQRLNGSRLRLRAGERVRVGSSPTLLMLRRPG